MQRSAIQKADHLASCADRADFPAPAAPEVALLGRSNVGKSSLLNRLVSRKQLARISATPGKTRLIHFYTVKLASGELRLVDLPGYGWARVSRGERARWQRLVESYLEGRASLRLALLLQDLRRDPSDDETLLLDWLGEHGIPSAVALTKVDKLKPMRRKARVHALRGVLGLPAERIVATSARTGQGIDELWQLIGTRLLP